MKTRLLSIAFSCLLLMNGCGGSTSSPFYMNEEAILTEVKKIEERFPGNPQCEFIMLDYEPMVGNIITVALKLQADSKMIESWYYRNTPVKAANRGVRMNVGSFGSWEKANERFEKENGMKYFDLNQIPWKEIPVWIAKANADMQQKGVSEPELGSFIIQNVGDGLAAYIVLKTMGGGSSVTYTFNMEGKLLSQS